MLQATRLLLACAVLAAAAWSATARPQKSANGTSSWLMEEPCARTGGLCLKEDECPEGSLTAQKGLCPEQQGLGVECCHGVSRLERRCHARGGICRPAGECRSRQLWLTEAKDCARGETCCALVA
ncbi:U-scoloptoxin(19)-Tl1a [Bacillus rossius redtenbacheri]|uniref:U-scoloptoxin(19)-Tl1a n=1 Tax=Bacillus rossius redtenbacheri TaxID=93214 RepID=UPI002FDDFDA7